MAMTTLNANTTTAGIAAQAEQAHLLAELKVAQQRLDEITERNRRMCDWQDDLRARIVRTELH
ncbi:MAG: hypothetical protein WA441_08380, partial [Methyloceanibacter sp.]